ncbi:alpha/beta fold hydrolase [Lacisediminimonas profundi]|uniref:alpha/beta fold hydrolase n=1 Tax=Lacisediminimonas profundi TaxID=2603856 RepID=UPI00124B22F9|nr:alpha/beta hydrolase [Lacisediminimonas profundi]
MNRPILHFAHGNSFPAETYKLFFQHLRHHYDVQALSMHAHNPAYPVRNGWHALSQELIAEIQHRHGKPVILAGHSMGGMLCLMAAKARPDLVRAVVLLDSPVVAGWRAVLLGMAKSAGIDKRFSPARFSERRRETWPTREEAYQHFAAKPVFAAWPQQVLRDYIEHGLVDHPQGVSLRFTRDTETAVYRTLPHHLGALVARGFRVPVGFIGGAESLEIRQAGLRATRKLVGRHFRLIPGSHLYPMEHPDAAADAVHQMVQSLLHERRGA